MPIQPWNKDRYPPNWPEISASIRKRAGNRCEQCGKHHGWTYIVIWDGSGRYLDDYLEDSQTPDGSPMSEWVGVWRDRSGMECEEPPEPSGDKRTRKALKRRESRCELTVAHLDHTPENNDPANLMALCQSCHLKLDIREHIANRVICRRMRQEKRGQQIIGGFDERGAAPA
jgi:hypothetical protein